MNREKNMKHLGITCVMIFMFLTSCGVKENQEVQSSLSNTPTQDEKQDKKITKESLNEKENEEDSMGDNLPESEHKEVYNKAEIDIIAEEKEESSDNMNDNLPQDTE